MLVWKTKDPVDGGLLSPVGRAAFFSEVLPR